MAIPNYSAWVLLSRNKKELAWQKGVDSWGPGPGCWLGRKCLFFTQEPWGWELLAEAGCGDLGGGQR